MSIPNVERWLARAFANHFMNRVGHKALFGLVMLLCLGWSMAQSWRPAAAPAASSVHAVEWPAEWDGAPLRPLALSEVEHRFAQRFPGAIARLTDGQSLFVMRDVQRPTRMLHPAADCYRALGYQLAQIRLERDAQARMWRCFAAHRAGTAPLRVCERIVDAEGTAFTDTSAWYWAAAQGKSVGPWQAVTMARPL